MDFSAADERFACPSRRQFNATTDEFSYWCPKVAELVVYSHATLFSPAISTLEQALKRGYIRNFPGLTAKTLQCHLPHSVATAKGHLDQVQQILHLTRVKPTDLPPTTTDDAFPRKKCQHRNVM
jgi:hypothetical protein